jgi:hypothetical protein
MTQKSPNVISNERRRDARFTIQAPATAIVDDREVRAFTRDVSSCGVYLVMAADETAPRAEDAIDLTIRIPPTLRRSTPCIITCHGRTVRTEYTDCGEIGLAIEMVDFAIHNAVPPRIRDLEPPQATSRVNPAPDSL